MRQCYESRCAPVHSFEKSQLDIYLRYAALPEILVDVLHAATVQQLAVLLHQPALCHRVQLAPGSLAAWLIAAIPTSIAAAFRNEWYEMPAELLAVLFAVQARWQEPCR